MTSVLTFLTATASEPFPIVAGAQAADGPLMGNPALVRDNRAGDVTLETAGLHNQLGVHRKSK